MIELLCTDYNKKATSIHYYFGNAVLGAGNTPFPLTTESARSLAVAIHHAMDVPTGSRT